MCIVGNIQWTVSRKKGIKIWDEKEWNDEQSEECNGFSSHIFAKKFLID
jgi:hypothetical protein